MTNYAYTTRMKTMAEQMAEIKKKLGDSMMAKYYKEVAELFEKRRVNMDVKVANANITTDQYAIMMYYEQRIIQGKKECQS